MKEKTRNDAERIKAFLEEHSCKDVEIIDMDSCSWTDCFVIATVNSVGHLKGIVRQIWDVLNELGLDVNNRHKAPGIDGWELIDCGDIVVHLMSQEMRDFYSLEKLWRKVEETEAKAEEKGE